MTRTSSSHPLRIDELALPGTNGLLGLTICPGKRQPHAASGAWERDLEADLGVIAAWGAAAIVNLVEEQEMRALGVADTAQRLPEGIDYYQLPIPDAGIPDAGWELAWQRVGPALRAGIAAGGRVLVHCKGGLGRTGLLAARILVEFGVPPADAVARVRAARPGAIETDEQLAYVLRLPWVGIYPDS
jgi:ADP-ribosyl-[dinitrogen reductase] hydrolase